MGARRRFAIAAGALNLSVRTADFDEDFDAIRHIRFTVFVGEQRVPEEIELDERDPHCLHLLACRGERPVGTGRIDIPLGGKVGRLAVLPEQRRRGIGTALMQGLHTLARQHGLARVWCHAQLAAGPFYESLGYRACEDVFIEAGIEHVKMIRDLSG